MVEINDYVECPYCGAKVSTDDCYESLDSNNRTDWECTNEECGKEFILQVEFEPIFSSEPIEIVECNECSKKIREDESFLLNFTNRTRICKDCYFKELFSRKKEKEDE